MKKQKFIIKYGKTIAVTMASMTAAFVLGVETSHDVDPMIAPTQAGDVRIAGDLDGNNFVDAADVRIALEIGQGYREATADELRADPNHDFRITSDDAIAILKMIEQR